MSSDGRQPPNEGSRKTVVPTASYPPMISGRVHPSAQLSSLRSIPHFSAPTTTTAADSSSSSSPMLSAGRESSPVPVRAGDARAVDDMATSTRHNNDKIAGRAQLPARAKFCQWDVLACINCAVAVPPHRPRPLPPRSDPADETATNSTPTRNNNTRKLGPLLLELRRLNFETDPLSSNIFVTTSICQSRGNPSLGSSVSSTCLDIGGSTSGVIPQGGSNTYVPPCATGLTTGALCIHSFATMMSDDEELMTPSIEYYHTPRHNRPATAVAWRPSNDSHVAIGLTGHTGGSNSASSGSNITNERQMDQVRRTLQVAGVSAAGGGSGSGGGANPGGDRDYCCFVWDIEHQSPPPPPQQQLSISTSQWNRRNKTAPLYKLSHNAGVASLGWVLDGGQTLVVGGQHRNLQMYDLRISATNAAPPVAVFGHNFGVHGIEVDPGRSSHFATYSREAGEAVKLWDARRMDSQLTEIKIGGGGASRTPSAISSVKWSTSDAGHLSIVVGNYLHQYDTLTSGSRAMHTNTIRTRKPIVDFTHYPFAEVENFESSEPPSSDSVFEKKKIFAELLPKRILAVKGDQFVSIVAAHRIAPISVSQRTGQVIHTLGGTLYFGSTSEGPAAMECPDIRSDEDISATMIRRAGCLHVAKYSMSTSSNIKMLANELTGSHQDSSLTTTDQLLRLWRWIQRAEALCCEPTDDSLDESNWPAKGLVDSGVLKLLEIDEGQSEEKSYSESLSCATYDSAGRRAALASCGWAGMFDLESVMVDCEDSGEYERSAALAVWHGDIGAAVDALQRGADVMMKRSTNNSGFSAKYAETLELVSLSVAGYRGGNIEASSSSHVWRKACANLLRRADLSDPLIMQTGAGYLRHVLKFLMTIGIDDSHKEVMGDATLSLCDRVAFACRFLSGADLRLFLNKCVSDCQSTGNVEGITVTGMEKLGIQILQSYVDRYSDVQTAALVTSRVVFPHEWVSERRIVAEWLHIYRSLLNRWQMWQSRAMFDVDRADLLRKFKMRQIEAPGKPGNRRMQPQVRQRQGMRLPDPDVQAAVPAQLEARCNYCSSSLGLRRQDNHANQWLSKMNNVIPCCPQCRKPLPRCAICMLSLGALNPYMELTKERPRLGPRGAQAQQAPDDLSSLGNLPFAEWFSWCLRCKHGGHAHHMVNWFAKHEVCPVSGCSCRCQFDGINKLQRPGMSRDAAPTQDGVAAEAKSGTER